MPDIKIDLIRPSPYQPRLRFDLEDIKGSIKRDGILVGLTVRKKDSYYELVDGERRLRVVKELGYKTVRCDMIDIDDDTARRMVWRVNTLRKDYEPKEKALFFKKMQDPPHGMSLRGIAREYDTSPHMVKAYLNVFKLPSEYQEMVWARELSIGIIIELEKLFNGVQYCTPKDNPEIFGILDRAVSEKHFGFREARETIKPYLTKLREERIKEAKKTIEKVAPRVKPPKTAEEFEEAAKILKREAKKRRTPKQIREEKISKAEKAFDKIPLEKAEKHGINIKPFKEKISKIRGYARKRPEDAASDIKELKAELKAKVGEVKEKLHERKIEKRVKEKAKTELLKDKEFLRAAAEKAETIEWLPEYKGKPPVKISPKEEEEIRRKVEEGAKRITDILSRTEVKRRGKLFRNWLCHGAVIDVAGSLVCPECGKPYQNLQWVCHGIPVVKAYELAKKKLDQEAKK